MPSPYLRTSLFFLSYLNCTCNIIKRNLRSLQNIEKSKTSTANIMYAAVEITILHYDNNMIKCRYKVMLI